MVKRGRLIRPLVADYSKIGGLSPSTRGSSGSRTTRATATDDGFDDIIELSEKYRDMEGVSIPIDNYIKKLQRDEGAFLTDLNAHLDNGDISPEKFNFIKSVNRYEYRNFLQTLNANSKDVTQVLKDKQQKGDESIYPDVLVAGLANTLAWTKDALEAERERIFDMSRWIPKHDGSTSISPEQQVEEYDPNEYKKRKGFLGKIFKGGKKKRQAVPSDTSSTQSTPSVSSSTSSSDPSRGSTNSPSVTTSQTVKLNKDGQIIAKTTITKKPAADGTAVVGGYYNPKTGLYDIEMSAAQAAQEDRLVAPEYDHYYFGTGASGKRGKFGKQYERENEKLNGVVGKVDLFLKTFANKLSGDFGYLGLKVTTPPTNGEFSTKIELEMPGKKKFQYSISSSRAKHFIGKIVDGRSEGVKFGKLSEQDLAERTRFIEAIKEYVGEPMQGVSDDFYTQDGRKYTITHPDLINKYYSTGANDTVEVATTISGEPEQQGQIETEITTETEPFPGFETWQQSNESGSREEYDAQRAQYYEEKGVTDPEKQPEKQSAQKSKEKIIEDPSKIRDHELSVEQTPTQSRQSLVTYLNAVNFSNIDIDKEVSTFASDLAERGLIVDNNGRPFDSKTLENVFGSGLKAKTRVAVIQNPSTIPVVQNEIYRRVDELTKDSRAVASIMYNLGARNSMLHRDYNERQQDLSEDYLRRLRDSINNSLPDDLKLSPFTSKLFQFKETDPDYSTLLPKSTEEQRKFVQAYLISRYNDAFGLNPIKEEQTISDASGSTKTDLSNSRMIGSIVGYPINNKIVNQYSTSYNKVVENYEDPNIPRANPYSKQLDDWRRIKQTNVFELPFNSDFVKEMKNVLPEIKTANGEDLESVVGIVGGYRDGEYVFVAQGPVVYGEVTKTFEGTRRTSDSTTTEMTSKRGGDAVSRNLTPGQIEQVYNALLKNNEVKALLDSGSVMTKTVTGKAKPVPQVLYEILKKLK